MWFLLALLASATNEAHPDEPFDPEWGLGTRVGVWGAEAAAPQLGGQVTLRPVRWIQWIGFADTSGRIADGVVQLDHVIGFHAVFPAARWSGGFVGPAVGSCVDFRTWRRQAGLAALRTDVLFGPRAGLHAQHRIDSAWTVQASATAMLYVGNTQGTYSWGAPATGLVASPAVQGQVGITRWFGLR